MTERNIFNIFILLPPVYVPRCLGLNARRRPYKIYIILMMECDGCRCGLNGTNIERLQSFSNKNKQKQRRACVCVGLHFSDKHRSSIMRIARQIFSSIWSTISFHSFAANRRTFSHIAVSISLATTEVRLYIYRKINMHFVFVKVEEESARILFACGVNVSNLSQFVVALVIFQELYANF